MVFLLRARVRLLVLHGGVLQLAALALASLSLLDVVALLPWASAPDQRLLGGRAGALSAGRLRRCFAESGGFEFALFGEMFALDGGTQHAGVVEAAAGCGAEVALASGGETQVCLQGECLLSGVSPQVGLHNHLATDRALVKTESLAHSIAG